ncbi:uncharacterized protein METZ01_LOCUS170134 [marine metagenome]|uniref:Uncharacterized protein n=1 Tax=marine metagenome TaxID=408172 RepID=A0A382BTY5_9ZZZZ
MSLVILEPQEVFDHPNFDAAHYRSLTN